jgi:hypothetical protein
MRRRVAALGALLIVFALFLYSNPSLTVSFGLVTSDTVFDKTSLVSIAPQNFSFYEVNLQPGDALSVSLATNPGNVDVLLMNQGNFSQWSQRVRGSYSTYPESALHVSNYSFSFTSSEPAQNYFVVMVAHSANESTNVLLHAVATRPSQDSILLLPLIVAFLGLIILVFAVRSGGRKAGRIEQESD